MQGKHLFCPGDREQAVQAEPDNAGRRRNRSPSSSRSATSRRTLGRETSSAAAYESALAFAGDSGFEQPPVKESGDVDPTVPNFRIRMDSRKAEACDLLST